MSDRDRMSDEIPVADAVEEDLSVEAPMEAATPDWHEQRQEVVGADEDDRDEYRE